MNTFLGKEFKQKSTIREQKSTLVYAQAKESNSRFFNWVEGNDSKTKLVIFEGDFTIFDSEKITEFDTAVLILEHPSTETEELVSRLNMHWIPFIVISYAESMAVYAYQLGAIHFLMKAPTQEDFKEIETRISRLTWKRENERLLLKNHKLVLQVNYQEILHVQSEGSYSKFFIVEDRVFLSSRNLKTTFEQFKHRPEFVRVSRFMILNTLQIREIIKGKSVYEIYFRDNSKLVTPPFDLKQLNEQ